MNNLDNTRQVQLTPEQADLIESYQRDLAELKTTNAQLRDENATLREENELLKQMSLLIFNIQNLSNEQLEELQRNCIDVVTKAGCTAEPYSAQEKA